MSFSRSWSCCVWGGLCWGSTAGDKALQQPSGHVWTELMEGWVGGARQNRGGPTPGRSDTLRSERGRGGRLQGEAAVTGVPFC